MIMMIMNNTVSEF